MNLSITYGATPSVKVALTVNTWPAQDFVTGCAKQGLEAEVKAALDSLVARVCEEKDGKGTKSLIVMHFCLNLSKSCLVK